MAGRDEARRGWRAWLRQELTWNKELVPIKIILFLYSGGTSSFLPYLTLHMKQLGITVTEISTIYAFLPIASILGPPITGLVADKYGRFKLMVFINMVLTIIFHVMLLYVPARPRNSLTLSCGPQGHALTWASCHACHQLGNSTNLNLTLKGCEFVCEQPPSELQFCFRGEEADVCRSFNLADKITINGTADSWEDEDRCGHTWHEVEYEGQVYQNLTCGGCPVRCLVQEAPPCGPPDDPHTSSSRTFWVYFVLRMIATFFLASLFTMMDAVTMAIVKQHGGDYGKQRFLFILGLATAPLLAGFAVDWYATTLGYSDYMPTFYLGAGMTLLAGLLITRLHFKVDRASENFLQDLKKLVTKPEINVFLLIILVMGSNWGFIESYLFIYLEDLNAPNYLMGLTLTVGSVVGMPVMLIADLVVEKLGRPTIFIISFFTYAVRHLGYSYISDPWMVFPFELLEVFTYQLMWVAAVTSCPLLAPKGLLATMTALVGTIHFSVGRGLGSLVGGHLIVSLGLPAAFRSYSAIALGAGFLYIVFHFGYFKRKLAAREVVRQEGMQQVAEDRPMLDRQEQTPTIVMLKNMTD